MYKRSLGDQKDQSPARSSYGAREYAGGQPESTPFVRSKGPAVDNPYGYSLDSAYSRSHNPYDTSSYQVAGSPSSRLTDQGYPKDYKSKPQNSSDPYSTPFGSYSKGAPERDTKDTSTSKSKTGPVRYEA